MAQRLHRKKRPWTEFYIDGMALLVLTIVILAAANQKDWHAIVGIGLAFIGLFLFLIAKLVWKKET